MRLYNTVLSRLSLLHYFLFLHQELMLVVFTDSFPLSVSNINTKFKKSSHHRPPPPPPSSSSSPLTSNNPSTVKSYLLATEKDSTSSTSASSSSSSSGAAEDAVWWDWEAVASTVFRNDSRPIVLFDGVCNLCSASTNFAIDRDPEANLRFASLQSTVGKSLLIRSGRDPDDFSSIVFCAPDGEAFVNSEAVLKIAQNLVGPLPWGVGRVGPWIPTWLRDRIFAYVSKNRYRLMGGDYDSCRLDFDGEYDGRFVSDPEL